MAGTTASLSNTIATMKNERISVSYLRKLWENVCNSYLCELSAMWGWSINKHSDYWIADETGGVFVYNDAVFINFDDMRYCVENNVSEEDFCAYSDYNAKAAAIGLEGINLKSWCKGCPRVDEESIDNQESIDNLLKMQKELFDEIAKVKNQPRKNPY